MTRSTVLLDRRRADPSARSLAIFGTLAAAAVVAAAWASGVTLGGPGLAFPGGVGLVALLGLTTDGDDDVDRLVAKIDRVRDGETDVSFETDGDDDLAALYAAVGDLADDLVACREQRASAEERSREQARQLDRVRPLIESAGDPMAVLDADGRFEVLNEAMAAFHGADRADLVGADATALVDDAGVATIEAAQGRLLADPDRAREQVELALTDAAGTERQFEATVGVFRDDAGEFAGSVLTFRDVTDQLHSQQALEAARDRLEANNRALRRLARIGADTSQSLDEKIQSVLDLGRSVLGTDGAFVSLIDEDADTFEFSHTSGTDDLLPPGTVAPMAETYCRKTVRSDQVFEVTAASERGWADDPAYERWGLETYVGAVVSVEGTLDGTLAFVDQDARDGSFTDDQRAFVELACRWIGYELERDRRRRRLERRNQYTDDVLDAIDDVFYVLDPDGTFRRWNQTLVETSGYDAEAVADMDAVDFFPEEERETIEDAVETVFETGDARVEARVLTASGEEIPYEFVASLLEDPDGNPVLAGIGRDISARTARERELRETKDRLSAVVEASPAALVALDEDDRVTVWNPAAERIFGWTEAEVLGDTFPLTPPEDDDHMELFGRVLEGETLTSVETKRQTRSGDLVDVSLSVAPYRDADGDIVGAMGAIEDITERKEREQRLRETTETLTTMIEASPAAIACISPDGTVTDWNPAAERIFGWTEDEVLGEPVPIVPDDRRAEFQEFVDRLLDGEILQRVETRRKRKDGTLIDVTVSAAPMHDEDGSVAGIVAVFEDVTAEKERQRELERTKYLLEQAQRLAGVVGWETDVTGEPPYESEFSQNIAHLLDLDPDGGVSMEALLSYARPDYRERRRAEFDRIFERGEAWEHETPAITPAGEERWLRSVGEPVYEDGELVAFRGAIQDVTERKEHEQQLRETTEMLEATIEASPAAIVQIAPDGTVAVWNPAAERIFGWSAAEVVGEQIPIAPDEPHHDEATRAALEERRSEVGATLTALDEGEVIERRETVRPRKDGTVIDVTISAAPLHDDEGEVVGYVGVFEDITDRKEAERQLRERERRLARYKDYTDEILDAIEDVFYVIDDEGTFLRWNEALPAVTGYADADIESRNALEFFPESEHTQILEAMDLVFAEPGSRRVEAPLVTRSGEEIPYEFVASTVENPDGEDELVGIGRDVTERNRRQAALERTTKLLEQAQRIAQVGGWEYDVETGELTLTDEFRRLHDIESAADVRIEDVLSQYHPDDLDYMRDTFDAAIQTGQSYDMEVRLLTADGGTRWVRALGEPVETSEGTTKIRGSIQDVTAAKEREEALRTLHDTAQGLLQTDSATEVSDLVVETASAVLDVSGVCLYLLDAEAGQLVPEAATEDYEVGTDEVPPIPVGDEDDVVWNSYATGTRRVFHDGDEAGADLFSDPVDGGLVVPIGDHGVLVVTTAQAGVPVRTRQLVETLVATTEAAFDRVESEASLRERDAELEARNRRLRRQIHLTDVIRRVDRSLVGANTQAEIENAVCEQLADAEDIAFAWIGAVDADGDALVPGTWAGSGETYLDAVSLSLTSEVAEPAVRTARSGDPTVVSNVLADVSNETWRKRALDGSFRSVLAVPIAFEEYNHGVLAVYADEPDAFGDLELTVFAELGQTIANAINAVKTREALHADTLLELSLRVEAPETFLAQVARRADTDVEYVGIGGQSGDETSVFFATDGEADVEAALEALVSVSEYRLLSEAEGRRVFEAAVAGPVLPAKLIRHGAQPSAIRATPTDVALTVSVSTSTDVREFVEMLGESYPTVELESRRTVTRATRTRQEMVSDLLEGLTDRQLEVLRTAYYAGYFDWPRGSSGEDIAEMLGVTQPTVSRHLRLGQRELLAQLLEEEPATVSAS